MDAVGVPEMLEASEKVKTLEEDATCRRQMSLLIHHLGEFGMSP
jgi:hypothetical protein